MYQAERKEGKSSSLVEALGYISPNNTQYKRERKKKLNKKE